MSAAPFLTWDRFLMEHLEAHFRDFRQNRRNRGGDDNLLGGGGGGEEAQDENGDGDVVGLPDMMEPLPSCPKELMDMLWATERHHYKEAGYTNLINSALFCKACAFVPMTSDFRQLPKNLQALKQLGRRITLKLVDVLTVKRQAHVTHVPILLLLNIARFWEYPPELLKCIHVAAITMSDHIRTLLVFSNEKEVQDCCDPRQPARGNANHTAAAESGIAADLANIPEETPEDSSAAKYKTATAALKCDNVAAAATALTCEDIAAAAAATDLTGHTVTPPVASTATTKVNNCHRTGLPPYKHTPSSGGQGAVWAGLRKHRHLRSRARFADAARNRKRTKAVIMEAAMGGPPKLRAKAGAAATKHMSARYAPSTTFSGAQVLKQVQRALMQTHKESPNELLKWACKVDGKKSIYQAGHLPRLESQAAAIAIRITEFELELSPLEGGIFETRIYLKEKMNPFDMTDSGFLALQYIVANPLNLELVDDLVATAISEI
ncbi:hypothetical protein BDK51DRAFT_35032 [Blyttiomyces helicus]|uniref:Uncharacterized protein n=1 Tax=Blyttiomyces helicus TaxID=388810 RepID=A0A4P9W5X5_9FUNG|nr:hypothetical protein BDK51DRAFT_35032 [Blyttiomyces helicus]|eukprot:RKO86735.1 hypothetical protein BDK51DRAFT_35032 [Blyttiomyces helicus]